MVGCCTWDYSLCISKAYSQSKGSGLFYTLVLMDINAIRIYGHALCGGLCSINACQHGSVAVIMQQAVLDAGGFIGKQELQEYMT